MTTFHKQLKNGGWEKLSLVEQMANVGSEVSRTINWKRKSKEDSEAAFFRALELLSLTMDDKKNAKRLKEIGRVKEMLIDWYLGNVFYKCSDQDWQRYFLQFNLAARIGK